MSKRLWNRWSLNRQVIEGQHASGNAEPAENLLRIRRMPQNTDMTLLKKGHSHRQDAKSAKIFKQMVKSVCLCELKRKEYSS
jgi:hypothetical protein